MRRLCASVGAVALAGLICWTFLPVTGQENNPEQRGRRAGGAERGNRAVERTRKQVRMLDAIYKGSIVLLTKQYVEDESDVPAGTVFKQIFAIAKDNGFHEVRLLDATGEAYNDENLPQDEFEKTAVKELKAGKDWYEQIVQEGDNRYLRVATPIPVALDKCVICHSNYEGVAPGTPIGALGYKVPIE